MAPTGEILMHGARLLSILGVVAVSSIVAPPLAGAGPAGIIQPRQLEGAGGAATVATAHAAQPEVARSGLPAGRPGATAAAANGTPLSADPPHRQAPRPADPPAALSANGGAGDTALER